MKKYINDIIKTVGGAFVFMLLLSSCDTWIDTSLNTDPDSPSDVPLNLMLPAIQQEMGYNLAGNDLVRTTNIWMQQFDGVDRQSFTEARYQLLPADVNNVWNTIFTDILMNAKVFTDKANAKVTPHNAGVGKVMTA